MRPTSPLPPAKAAVECVPGPVHVLCPRGRDPFLDFSNGIPTLSDIAASRIHPPLNHHAWAACTGGAFHSTEKTLPFSPGMAAIVLLRRDLASTLRAAERLRKAGAAVILCWKEAGLFQVSKQLEPRGARGTFQAACAIAHGALACTPELAPLFAAAGARAILECPTPLPLGLPGWDASAPEDTRAGIFLGTREFDVPARCHAMALEIALDAARKARTFVTAISVKLPPSAWRKALRAAASEGLYREVPGPLPYPDYLRLLARHQAVFQLDRGAVPGQVAGDALLARTLLIGGDGATDRIAFTDTCGHGRSLTELAALLDRALDDPAWRTATLDAALQRARDVLSFGAVRQRLHLWLKSLALASPLAAP